MTGWANIVAGLVQAFNLIAGWARDNGLRRQGAEKAELERLRKRKNIRRKADEIDSRPVPESDRDILDRL
ncbi:MAG: hypothetical protein IH994_07140 [Proteobacteria bacterium]|nr:hypothetical protein [Pseudomonadota bacterium]